MDASAIDKALQAVCPISGISVGSFADKSTWRVDFPDGTSFRFGGKSSDPRHDLVTSVIVDYDVTAQPVQTTEEKLQSLGLTAQELKAAMA